MWLSLTSNQTLCSGPAVDVQSPNPRTTRQVPILVLYSPHSPFTVSLLGLSIWPDVEIENTSLLLFWHQLKFRSKNKLSMFKVVGGLVTKSYLTLFNMMDCSSPGSSVHGISQARILEWVAISSSKGASQPRDWTHICIAGRFFTNWAIKEAIFKVSVYILERFEIWKDGKKFWHNIFKFWLLQIKVERSMCVHVCVCVCVCVFGTFPRPIQHLFLLTQSSSWKFSVNHIIFSKQQLCLCKRRLHVLIAHWECLHIKRWKSQVLSLSVHQLSQFIVV